MDFNVDGVARNQLLAALAGGFIAAWKASIPGISLLARITNGIGGTLFAIFFGQLLFWFYGLQHPAALGGITFLCGVFGMALTDSVLNALSETRLGEFFNSILERIGNMFGKEKS